MFLYFYFVINNCVVPQNKKGKVRIDTCGVYWGMCECVSLVGGVYVSYSNSKLCNY